MKFGILTLATPNDYKKAIGLALSARVSNPGVPTAVACSPRVRPLVEPYFDYVVDEYPALRGFVHKVHLDRYSPFDETFFFDSDVLLFRPLAEVLDDWRGRPYGVCGTYTNVADGGGWGLDRRDVLTKIGKERLVYIDGAGHAYFKKPDCQPVFDLAREVTANYQEWAKHPHLFADEEVLDVVMTLLDIEPMPHGEFFSRHLSAKGGTIRMDAARAECVFVAVTTGLPQRPHMMHFAANEAPWTYARQLKRLFRKFDAPSRGIYRAAAEDFFVTNIEWPLKAFAKRLLGL